MPLKYLIDTLDGLPPAVREHYTKTDDGKYRLTLDGDHPDTAKVAEFRTNNIKVTKENDDLKAKYEGIDPAVFTANQLKLKAFEDAKPNEKIAALETQLADANRRANGAVLKDVVISKFYGAGGRANAADYILSKAADKFTVENGVVVGTVFDPNQPGVKLTVEAFIEQQLQEADFAFKSSSGGGANPIKGAGGPRSGAKELRNPDARELGAHGDAIRRGDVRVVYDNE